MKECKILYFEISPRHTVKQNNSVEIRDYPETEQELNRFLLDGWTVQQMGIHFSCGNLITVFYLERER